MNMATAARRERKKAKALFRQGAADPNFGVGGPGSINSQFLDANSASMSMMNAATWKEELADLGLLLAESVGLDKLFQSNPSKKKSGNEPKQSLEESFMNKDSNGINIESANEINEPDFERLNKGKKKKTFMETLRSFRE